MHRSNRTKIPFITLFLLIVTTEVLAERQIYVNGLRLNAMQIGQLDYVACTAIPDGNYWIDMNSRAWGYAGSMIRMGTVGDACRQRQSLSERRQLYRPGEILSE